MSQLIQYHTICILLTKLPILLPEEILKVTSFQKSLNFGKVIFIGSKFIAVNKF